MKASSLGLLMLGLSCCAAAERPTAADHSFDTNFSGLIEEFKKEYPNGIPATSSVEPMMKSLRERGFTNFTENDLRHDPLIWFTNIFTVQAGLPRRILDWPAPKTSDTNQMAGVYRFIEINGWSMDTNEDILLPGGHTEPINGLPWPEIAERTFEAVTQGGILYVPMTAFGPDCEGVAWNPRTNNFPRWVSRFKPLGSNWYAWSQDGEPSTPADRQYESATNEFRPFQPIVEKLRTENPQRQYEYFVRLSKGLMAEGYAAFTGQREIPHFGDLVDELYRQNMVDVLRAMMKKREIGAAHFLSVAERLSRNHDAEAFRILLANTDRSMTNIVEASGEDIDAYSAICLRYYLTDEKLADETRSHLIKLLLHHGHPSVRAFAAESLQTCHSLDAIAALQRATNDNGRVLTLQGRYDHVREYAEEALKKVSRNP